MECCSASLLPILHARFHTSFVSTSLDQRLLHSFMRLSSRHGASLSTAAGLEPPTCQTQPQKAEIYTTLQHKVSSELEVKRSKFIAVAAPIRDEEGAHAFLSEVRDPRATHNCWAYKLGEQYRSNDDGEPGGTAGRPIHSAIVSSGLDRVMAVVIRYFGGIKLGTGGLVRAYGGVMSDCLKDAPTCVVKSKVAMVLGVPFDLLGSIYPLVPSKRRRLFFLIVLDCFYTLSKTNSLLFCRFYMQKSDLKAAARRFSVPRNSPQRLASTSPNGEGFGQ